MDSVFFYQMTLHRDNASGPITASWVSKLPLIQQVINQIVVLTGTEGLQAQGMYVWDGTRWRYTLPYDQVCESIIQGATIEVFYSQSEPYTQLPSNASLWKNGIPVTGTVIEAGGNSVWTALVPAEAGDVSSVNSVTPDGSGNVEIGISDIPGLQTALDNAGSVKTVNGASPDDTGNVTVPVATASVAGTVKPGTGLEIAPDGTLSVSGGAGTVTSVNGLTGEVVLTASNITGFAAVATSGSYDDLSDLPTPYTLPVATSTVLGGVKQGANVSIAGDGTISVAGPYTLPEATASTLGGVIVGSGINVSAGTISVTPYTLPAATTSTLGGVIVGSGLSVTAGTVSANVTSVSGLTGAVVIKAEDNNDTSGTTLISDSGATDGTIKLKTLVAGNNITITTDANGNLAVASTGGVGSVTSVALSMPSIFNVSGSPVTGTGTLTAVLAGQNANTFFRGPTSGSADIPTFGAIVAADLPLATTSVPGAVTVGSGLAVSGGLLTANVLTVAGQVGNIDLSVGEINGAAPLASPAFSGVPTAPTPTAGTNNTQIATTAFVLSEISAFDLPPATTSTLGGVIVGAGLTVNGSGGLSANVTSVAGKTGAVTLAVADVSGAAPLASPTFTGVAAAPTATPGTNTTQLATTAFVQAAVTAGSVTSFNTRTGAVTLVATDLQIGGTGAFILDSPQFTGTPTAPTAGAGTSTTQLATTAFVATSYAPLASPALTGVPTAPTATAGTNNTQIATTAFVQALVTASGVTTFNGRAGAVTLEATDLQVGGTGAFILASPQFTGTPTSTTPAAGNNSTDVATTAFVATSFAPLASPALTGTPTAPTATAGTNTTQLATTAFVQAAVGGYNLPEATTSTLGGVIVGSGLSVTSGTISANVLSVNGQTGAVVLAVANISGAAPTASPTFTGTPVAPTATQGDNTTQLATDAFVQNAVRGTETVTTTGSTLTLTANQYSVGTIVVQGALTSNATIVFPTSGNWTIVDETTGAFDLTLEAGNGSGATFVSTQGATFGVNANGNNLTPSEQLGVTRATNDSTSYLATTAFVANAIGGLDTGVTSFNTRTGAITLQASDLQVGGTGAFILASPQFTGTPVAPTATAGTSTTQLATTAFVATSYAPLASPALTGVPTAPTATAGTSTTQIATTAYVATSYAPLASPAFTGVPVAPTVAQGDNSTSLATTAFVERYLNATVTVPLTNANVTLSAAQYSSEIIEFTGALTASVVITVPTSGQWVLYNNTTGAFNVTISNGSGATYALPQNESASLVSLTTVGVVNANIAGNTLTPATATTLGGVIVPNGGGLAINSSGDLSVLNATTSTLGGVIVGSGLTVTSGTIAVASATSSGAGIVSQGSGVTISGSGVLSANVVSVFGRTGSVLLQVTDITGAGGAPAASPTLTGTVTVPTPAAGSNTTVAASTAYVYAATQGVATINLTGGATTLVLTAAQYSQAVLQFTGTLTANIIITMPANGSWEVLNLCTGAFTVTLGNGISQNLVIPQASENTLPVVASSTAGMVTISGGGSTVVNTFNTRSGAVTLTNTDISGAGGALLASPVFTGTPQAPTAAVGDNSVQLATDAYVYTATQGSATVPLAASNVTLSAAQYSVPVIIFTGTLTANVTVTVPTSGHWTFYNATSGSFTVTLANGTGATAVVPQSGTATSPYISDGSVGVLPVNPIITGVSSVNGNTGAVTGIATLASPTFTGVPAAPTATAGTNTTQLATTQFVTTAVSSYAPLNSPVLTGVPAAPTATAGTSTTQIATTAFVATSYAPLASPTFSGRVQSPAYSYTVDNIGSTAGTSGTLTLNLGLYSEFAFTPTGAFTLAFTNTLGANLNQVTYLRITNGGTNVSWPSGSLFSGGTAPTLSTSGIDMIGVKYDSISAAYMIFTLGLAMAT